MIDIYTRLIPVKDVQTRLASVFTNTIILDMEFKMRLLSQNVLEALHYADEELIHESIDVLCRNKTLRVRLHNQLEPGYFLHRQDELMTKDGVLKSVRMSGFYSGVATDINGFIILKLDFPDAFNRAYQQQVDEFIYRAAHDLRGPLATIRGLINLLKMRQDNTEVDRFVGLLESHAQLLDERLLEIKHLSGRRYKFE